MALPRIRIVAFNDVYELKNLPRVQTFLSQLSPVPSAVVLAGDFLSPSTLSALDSGKGEIYNSFSVFQKAILSTLICLLSLPLQ